MLYKLPTVVISRRTDQYSKAYEHLMGQVPQQGIPRARAHALPKAPSAAAGAQVGLTMVRVEGSGTNRCLMTTIIATLTCMVAQL